MIKTLRITSVIAAILAAGFIVFPMIFGFRSDEDIERFLNSPSVIDRYRQARGGKPQPGVETSPLVAQAMKFAGYINPPKSAPVVRQPGVRGPTGTPPPPPKPEITTAPPEPHITTAKFNVVVTSYHESQPDMSVALIDQPGAGRRWVREGAEVMHLTIEKIKEGAIMVKGGQGVFELAVPKVREVNLLDDGSPSASAGSVPASVPASIAALHTLEAPTDTRAADVGGRITQPVPPGVSEEERARAEKLFAELETMAIQRDPAAGGPGSQSKVSTRQGARGAPGSAPEATRIGDEEAEKLDDLGQELKKVGQPDRGREGSKDRRADRGRNLKDPRARIDQRLEERRKRIEALAQKRMRRKQAPEDQKRPEE
jgi:hypothetical protein